MLTGTQAHPSAGGDQTQARAETVATCAHSQGGGHSGPLARPQAALLTATPATALIAALDCKRPQTRAPAPFQALAHAASAEGKREATARAGLTSPRALAQAGGEPSPLERLVLHAGLDLERTRAQRRGTATPALKWQRGEALHAALGWETPATAPAAPVRACQCAVLAEAPHPSSAGGRAQARAEASCVDSQEDGHSWTLAWQRGTLRAAADADRAAPIITAPAAQRGTATPGAHAARSCLALAQGLVPHRALAQAGGESSPLGRLALHAGLDLERAEAELRAALDFKQPARPRAAPAPAQRAALTFGRRRGWRGKRHSLDCAGKSSHQELRGCRARRP